MNGVYRIDACDAAGTALPSPWYDATKPDAFQPPLGYAVAPSPELAESAWAREKKRRRVKATLMADGLLLVKWRTHTSAILDKWNLPTAQLRLWGSSTYIEAPIAEWGAAGPRVMDGHSRFTPTSG